MRAFWRKSGHALVPACEASEKAFHKLDNNELIETDVKGGNARSVQWNKRYWSLCQMVCDHAPESFEFKTRNDVHFFLKVETHTYDGVIVTADGNKAYCVASIAFHNMSSEEWQRYWSRMLDVLYDKIFPEVEFDEVRNEIERCAGLAA